jgi:hypothetical protein
MTRWTAKARNHQKRSSVLVVVATFERFRMEGLMTWVNAVSWHWSGYEGVHLHSLLAIPSFA